MKIHLNAFFLSTAGFMFGQPAFAQVCVSIDDGKDNLSAADRAAAKNLLADALRENGQTVVATPCDNAFTAYHVQLGKRINVVLARGAETRKGHVGSIEE